MCSQFVPRNEQPPGKFRHMDTETLTPGNETALSAPVMGLHTSQSHQTFSGPPTAGPGSAGECPRGDPKGSPACGDACVQAPGFTPAEHLHMPATAKVIELFTRAPPAEGAEGQPPPAGAPVTILEAPYHLEAWMAETRGMVLVDACIPITALESLLILLKRPGHFLEVDDKGSVQVKYVPLAQ